MRFHGIIAASGKIVITAPSITADAVTNFNQNRATFNATVNPNGGTTSVKFQYKRNADSTWTDGATISGLTGGSQTVYSNQTSLAYEGTLYNVRAIATNSAGSTTSSSVSFTTWSKKSVSYTTSTTLAIPTITPTGGSAVVPVLYDILVIGGGGGGNAGGGGGGGGGFTTAASSSFSNTSNLTLTITVGAGGGSGANGGTSSLGNTSFTTISASGGAAGGQYGGNAGTGGYAGGGYVEYSNNDSKNLLYCFAYGGGGGAGGAGSAGTSSTGDYNGYAYGGNGGALRTDNTYGVTHSGGGGGGYGSTQGGQNGTSAGGTYGAGGLGNGTSGGGGAIYFKYYGP